MSGLPANIERFLYSGGTWYPPGEDGEECEGAAFHSPRPLFTQHIPLVSKEWAADLGQPWELVNVRRDLPRASLCGTCRDNLNILLQMLHATDGELEWPVRREFGNALRALATKGWKWFEERRPAPAEEPAS